MRLVGRLRKDAIASWEFEEAFWLPFRAYPDWGFFELSVTLGSEAFWGNAPLLVCFWGDFSKVSRGGTGTTSPIGSFPTRNCGIGVSLVPSTFLSAAISNKGLAFEEAPFSLRGFLS